MARFKSWRKALCALFCGLFLPILLWANQAAQSALAYVPQYRAVYEVEIRGVRAGEMTLESITTDKTYRVDARTIPSTAAKMLGFGEIRERAYGRVQSGKIVPEKYERVMAGDDDYFLNYQYDAKKRAVDVQKGKSALQLEYIDGEQALDILALITQALLDESQNKTAKKYSLLSEDKLRNYQIRRLPDEIWQQKSGERVDVRVYEQTNGERKTVVYLAQNPLRLAKLQQLRNNETRFSLKLLNYQVR